ncbi:hypothetical protein ACFL1X_07170 [Candidatus Hydrogenedentota bacterium]
MLNGATAVLGADIDGDGHMDVVAPGMLTMMSDGGRTTVTEYRGLSITWRTLASERTFVYYGRRFRR